MSVNKYDSATDTLTKVAGNATVPIDDTTSATDKVYSSSKVENSFLKFNGYITDGADLNNFTEDGRYYVQDVDLVNAIPNYGRTRDWGFLEVVSFPNYISQSYITFVNMFRQEYVRRYYNGNWSNWKLANPDYYSTTETMTNKVWTDGKLIYRKVVSGVTGAKDEWKDTFDVSDLHIDNLISFYGFIKRDDGVIINVPCDGFMAHLNFPTVGYIGTKQMYSWANFNIYVTIEYTKTTD